MTQARSLRMLFTGKHQRTAIVGAATAFFVVALAGLASACVPWGGEFEAKPTGSNSSDSGEPAQRASSHVHGDYGSSVMEWCGKSDQDYDSAIIQPSGNTSEPDIEIVNHSLLSSCDSEGDELRDDNYYVTAVNSGFNSLTADGDGFSRDEVDDGDRDNDCMFRPSLQGPNTNSPKGGVGYLDDFVWNPTNDSTFVIDDITVNSGSGTGGLVASSDHPGTSVAGICITASNPNTAAGHQAPEGIMIPVHINNY